MAIVLSALEFAVGGTMGLGPEPLSMRTAFGGGFCDLADDDLIDLHLRRTAVLAHGDFPLSLSQDRLLELG